jgi:hypothetical protein
MSVSKEPEGLGKGEGSEVKADGVKSAGMKRKNKIPEPRVLGKSLHDMGGRRAGAATSEND